MNPLASKNPAFLNRELSWLEFNARVLHEAEDERTPLLERVKFLAIYGSNLDEFYMVRVAGLRRQLSAGVLQTAVDGLSPAEQLALIDARVLELNARARTLLKDTLLPALRGIGVRLLAASELEADERETVAAFFDNQVFPVLTPLAVDPGHPFPYISNLSLSLAVELRDPEQGDVRFARVKVPKSLPRWVPTGRPNSYIPLEALIGDRLDALFPGMEVLGHWTFRLTRYSDLEISHTEEPEDLLASIEEQLFQRRFGEVVRLEVEEGTPAHLRALLLDELRGSEAPEMAPLTERELHAPGPLLDLSDFLPLSGLDFPEHRDPPLIPAVPPELRDTTRSIFDVVREQEILIHHPFDSFGASVETFIESAARDEQVLAIKMTLYRTSGDGAIVQALTEAAQRGKQVAVLVELQARFDEINNIAWARTLESFGVHVVYGLPGLKTHTKTALVVRKEADGIRRYVHIGTGNYNTRTARIYTDLGLITCDEAIGADITDLFNSLTGYSRQREYRRLVVAPVNMRERVLGLIAREAAHARAGRPGRIIAKMNALVDAQIVEALYDASDAGVEIDLIIRGICCLRPGVEGLSERIRVISIIGRFLEHSRIWMFGNDGAPEYYFGSADWMPRNLDRRVEVVTPVENPLFQRRIQSVLDVCLSDNRQAWDLKSDGSYVQRQPEPGRGERATHRMLLRDSWGGSRESGAFTFDVSPLQRSKEPGRPPSSTAEFRAFSGG
ncbi:MAG: polyphosphate kinase 1 [Gemmatimonadaceae bacterium]|nr:polyphosphate kinase 1 [Gemmatimonadaceae bacterium]MCW5825710.1 polyphosphate kinase 1 [Gemmatimonadaceae bacterium]